MGRGSGIVTAHGVFSKRRKELEEQALRRRGQDQDLYKALLGQGFTPPPGVIPEGWQAPERPDVGKYLKIIAQQDRGLSEEGLPMREKGPGETISLSPPSTRVSPNITYDISSKLTGGLGVKTTQKGKSSTDVAREQKEWRTRIDERSKVKAYLASGTTAEIIVDGKKQTVPLPPPDTLETAMAQLEEWGLNPYTHRELLKDLPRQTETYGKRPSEYGFFDKIKGASARISGAVRDMPLITAAPFTVPKRKVPFAGPEEGFGFKVPGLGYGYEGMPEAGMYYKKVGNINAYSSDQKTYYDLKTRDKITVIEDDKTGRLIATIDMEKFYDWNTGKRVYPNK